MGTVHSSLRPSFRQPLVQPSPVSPRLGSELKTTPPSAGPLRFAGQSPPPCAPCGSPTECCVQWPVTVPRGPHHCKDFCPARASSTGGSDPPYPNSESLRESRSGESVPVSRRQRLRRKIRQSLRQRWNPTVKPQMMKTKENTHSHTMF